MRTPRSNNRRSATRVKAGKVQTKNNQTYTGGYWNAEMPWLVVDRQRPGPGYKHLLGSDDIYAFLKLIPNYADMEDWLRAVVLAPGDPDAFGYHSPGVIEICAWPRDLWTEWGITGLEHETPLLEMLQVPYEVFPDESRVICKFNEQTARAHQLLGTFLHELGHHLDRITTHDKARACRGEPFARDYALCTARLIFDEYADTFGI